MGAALGYDAVRLLAHAIAQRAGSSDPEKLAAALHAIHGWPAVSRPCRSTPPATWWGWPIRHVVVRGGRFEYLDDSASAAAPARVRPARRAT